MTDPKPLTRWRNGDRDPEATAAHSASTTAWKREIADAALPEHLRAHVLALIAAGTPVADAAAEVLSTAGGIYGYARRDPQFRAQLDEATRALCIGRPDCGSAGAYRWGGCRGTDCRRNHTDQSRRTRGTA